MKRIRSLFFQCTTLLLLAFIDLAGVSFLLIEKNTEPAGKISSVSASDNVDSLFDPNNPAGGDDDNDTGDKFFNQPTHLFYPSSATEEKDTILSLQHSFIALYLLYHRLVFYHPVA